MDLLKTVTNEQLKPEVPVLNVGDTVRVSVKIKEGNKERIQAFEGTIIAKHNNGISSTFTVRRVAYGCGVERTFLVHSPNVAKVEVIRCLLYTSICSNRSIFITSRFILCPYFTIVYYEVKNIRK